MFSEPTKPVSEFPADTLGVLRVWLLLLWAGVSFGLMFFARDLQRLAGGVPLSFWLAAQGIVLVFVAIVGGYAWAANRAEGARAAQVSSRHDIG